jgi:phage protein D/phage baseplate assembly protein gpV
MKPLRTITRALISVAGRHLNTGETRALTGITVQQRLSSPSLCELTFTDLTGDMPVMNAFLPGLSLEVRFAQDASDLFTGEVTAVEFDYLPSMGRVLRVRAYDKLHRLRKRQPVRVHVQVSLTDLARELSADLGLAVEGPSLSPVWRKLIQYRHSDLDFLLELSERCGLYLFLRDNVLSLVSLEGRGKTRDLYLGDNLSEARFEVNGDPACRDVRAMGWDPGHNTWHTSEAFSSSVHREVAAHVKPQDVGGSGRRTLTNHVAFDETHTAGAAIAELDRRTAREVIFRGVAQGDAALLPGSRISVRGVDASLEGVFVVTAVRHVVSRESGYLSHVTTELPARRAQAGGFMTAPARVTRVDDPEKLGRIQVSLPTFADLETDWMCVLSAAAGAGKGFIAMPDAGDQVLVLCSADNPAAGFVLGSLYGSGTHPDTGIEAGVVARYTLLTPGGQRLTLDDSKKSARIENNAGSYVEMLPQHMTMHAATDLIIEAPGHRILIQGQLIDFKRA